MNVQKTVAGSVDSEQDVGRAVGDCRETETGRTRDDPVEQVSGLSAELWQRSAANWYTRNLDISRHGGVKVLFCLAYCWGHFLCATRYFYDTAVRLDYLLQKKIRNYT